LPQLLNALDTNGIVTLSPVTMQSSALKEVPHAIVMILMTTMFASGMLKLTAVSALKISLAVLKIALTKVIVLLDKLVSSIHAVEPVENVLTSALK